MIEIRNVSYGYKRSETLFADLNLDIKNGTSWGVLGFNGAGKSTLIKMLLGIIRPNKGSICINGLSVTKYRKKIVRQIGVVWGQKPTLWWDVPVIESYKMLKKIYRLSDSQYEKRIHDLDYEFRVSEFWDRPLRTLSLGQRIKAEIVGSLLHSPSILVYDEPFIGLDFIARKKLLEVLKKYKEDNKCTFLLTSHNISDIEELCGNILLIDHGKVVFTGEMEKLKRNYAGQQKIVVHHNNEKIVLSNAVSSKVKKMSEEDYITQIIFNNQEIGYQELIEDICRNNNILSINNNDDILEQIIENLVYSERIMDDE